MARQKKKAKQRSRTLERVYLIVTLVAVAGVAVFLGYVVGQYAIQAATGALNRELMQPGEEVRQKAAPGVQQVSPDPSQRAEAEPTTKVEMARPPGVSDQPPTIRESAAQTPVVSPPPSQPLYRVQVGAFSSEANARGLADELISKGYEALVIPGSLHRVQVGAFSQRDNAETLKRELEGKGYPAAVISGE
ncbi:MAG: hypothetical protein GX998_07310 [Firmicutes bacterium]|nr:hypothetical protein [Bacillota bacterium]